MATKKTKDRGLTPVPKTPALVRATVMAGLMTAACGDDGSSDSGADTVPPMANPTTTDPTDTAPMTGPAPSTGVDTGDSSATSTGEASTSGSNGDASTTEGTTDAGTSSSSGDDSTSIGPMPAPTTTTG